MKRKTINIDPIVYNTLKDFCEENALILSKLVEKMIMEYVEQNKAEK